MGDIKLNDENRFSIEDVVRIHRILFKHSMHSQDIRQYIQKSKAKMLKRLQGDYITDYKSDYRDLVVLSIEREAQLIKEVS
jgi:actin-related protein